MRGKLKSAVALLLALAIGSTTAMAFDYPDVVRPGETISFGKGDFYARRDSYNIPGEVELSTENFAIAQKKISKGANLVKDIKINSRSEEVEITFTSDTVVAAPSSNNVIINELSIKAKRTIRDGDRNNLISSGEIYKFDGSLGFRVGLDMQTETMFRDGVELALNPGDSSYIKWVKDGGDGYGTARISYGNMAYLEGRVYEGDKVLYTYNDEVDWKLEDANDNAYIQAVNMGSSSFPASMQLQLLANKNDYIYEYNDGKLTAAGGLKWSEEDYAWVGKLTKGKHFIISDVKLRGASGTTGSNSSSDNYYDDESSLSSSSSNSNSYDNEYYNPSTGGGSNVAVAVSAIVAVVAIALVSIIMSTILTVKKK